MHILDERMEQPLQKRAVSPLVARILRKPAVKTGQSPVHRAEAASDATSLSLDMIRVRGARQHNLRNVHIDIPRNKFVVLTGVSGSGKSSLAFDTIYAEGQRRYVESLSPFIRHYMEKVERPQVDWIYGLSPAIAIEQKTVSRNPRSTVGTITEIINYIRLLYSRVGLMHCTRCGSEISRWSATEMTRRLSELPAGTAFSLYAYPEQLVTHEMVPATELPQWREKLLKRVRAALKLGKGAVRIDLPAGERIFLGEQAICPLCGFRIPFLSSQHFSPTAPAGMCVECNGLGVRLEVDPALIVEDPTRSVLDGALRWYGDLRKKMSFARGELESIAQHYQTSLELPWQELPERMREAILFGSGEEKLHIRSVLQSSQRAYEKHGSLPGLVSEIMRLYRQTTSEKTRKWCSSFMSQRTCVACQGTGLMAEARAVTLAGRNIIEVSALAIDEVLAWLDHLSAQLDPEALLIADEIIQECRQRLRFLLDVGLHYLTLSRPAPTLSGGEGQRLRLASQLGSRLTGVLYVLDEPSIGLHQRDQQTLLHMLKRLRDLGNTVLVVEHDEETMRQADWLIDVGPGAGIQGGQIIAAGTPEQVAHHPNSLTGRYLRGDVRIVSPRQERRHPVHGWLSLEGARLHNLKGETARFPLGLFTCVTGVSGGGKSSLINGTLYPALAHHLHQSSEVAGPYERLKGAEQLKKVITITQEPIGRTPRSNPATYTGIFDEIRALFAGTELARQRHYKADRFSFNVEGGRCETCKGQGQIAIDMHFLADVWIPCKDCEGSRFKSETLEIRYRGKNIAEVLAMDVEEALRFFSDSPKITRVLRTLQDVGLGYIGLGQSAMTFSGGEAQRIKLARELSSPETGNTLYILDEPTTGLHFADVQRLLDVLHRLVDAGNTVIVIEHNMDVVKTADWVLDMGPEGGASGGHIIAEGTPEAVARCAESVTGRFLRI
uniref:UvrABC system protein A n=1 Tax=Thermosporothrix sp. COM3 TaxID=2490863 RepID=A0A455SM40_9CHLR|nr:UvrABC system protein A [Thermosporothrix sp. COM3]